MTDIFISKTKSRAYIRGESKKGKQWLDKNYSMSVIELFRSVNIDVADELVETLKNEGLEVEVK